MGDGFNGSKQLFVQLVIVLNGFSANVVMQTKLPYAKRCDRLPKLDKDEPLWKFAT